MGRLTNLNPPAPIADADLPPSVARDAEFQAADAAHVNASDPHIQYLKRSLAHNTSASTPDSYTVGITSQDLYIRNVLAGYHILTLLRADNNNFGVQLAMADTQSCIFYRYKAGNVWQSWLNVTLS